MSISSKFARPTPVFVGAVFGAAPDVPEPAKPYTDKQRAAAITAKMGGILTSVFAVIPKLQQVFTANLPKSADPSVDFVKFILANLPDGWETEFNGRQNAAIFYGFGVSDILRVAGVRSARAGIRVPPSLWRNNTNVCDPLLAIEESKVSGYTAAEIADWLDLTGVEGYTPNWIPNRSAEADVSLAASMVSRLRLGYDSPVNDLSFWSASAGEEPLDYEDEEDEEDEDTADAVGGLAAAIRAAEAASTAEPVT